jgi:methionyl-tRNA formyltransferase
MRVIFFGTPEFATPALRETAAHAEVLLVLAQPDRPKGRGRVLTAPPVKEVALELGVPCMQVESPNAPGAIAALKALAPDLFVVVAYGAILSRELLALPSRGAINLHGSLLPAYRGASPIQAAIADGRATTGACTMWMDEGLDTGDVILCEEIAIGSEETAGELSARLADVGGALLARTLDALASGDPPRTPQRADGATVTKRLKKADGFLDFTQPARRVHDRARAMTPWPGAQAEFEGEPVRFTRTHVAENVAAGPISGAVLGTGPGNGLLVACGDGALEVLRLLPSGRPEMDAQDWWRGLRRPNGSAARFTAPRAED